MQHNSKYREEVLAGFPTHPAKPSPTCQYIYTKDGRRIGYKSEFPETKDCVDNGPITIVERKGEICGQLTSSKYLQAGCCYHRKDMEKITEMILDFCMEDYIAFISSGLSVEGAYIDFTYTRAEPSPSLYSKCKFYNAMQEVYDDSSVMSGYRFPGTDLIIYEYPHDWEDDMVVVGVDIGDIVRKGTNTGIPLAVINEKSIELAQSLAEVKTVGLKGLLPSCLLGVIAEYTLPIMSKVALHHIPKNCECCS